MRHNKRVMTVLDLSDQDRKLEPLPEFIPPPKWDKARILPDLTRKPIIANPDAPRPLTVPIVSKLSPAREAREYAIERALADPQYLPEPKPDSKPLMVNMIRDVFPIGAQRTGFKRPTPRGQGPKKLFSKDTPNSVRYHASYKDMDVAPDPFTKKAKRAPQVQIRNADLPKLFKAGIVLSWASAEQISGLERPPFLVTVGEQLTAGVGGMATGKRRFYVAHRTVDGKRREITLAQFQLALGWKPSETVLPY